MNGRISTSSWSGATSSNIYPFRCQKKGSLGPRGSYGLTGGQSPAPKWHCITGKPRYICVFLFNTPSPWLDTSRNRMRLLVLFVFVWVLSVACVPGHVFTCVLYICVCVCACREYTLSLILGARNRELSQPHICYASRFHNC